MDRDEALKLLKGGPEGIREWNERRKAGEEIPSLEEADLSTAYLGKANLFIADLNHADLSNANLTEATLDNANLDNANLSNANLNNASLRGANLSNADLRGAVFVGTVFYEGTLDGADFDDCFWANTTIGSDLSVAKNLDYGEHGGPSIVSAESLLSSKQGFPVAFLRGCGVPDILIEYLPTLRASVQPIQFYSCFISYSSKDEEFAERLYARMQQEHLRVWFAPEDMKGGRKMHEQIDEAIRVYDKLLLVLSPESMNSNWVELELRKARARERSEDRPILFPISITEFDNIETWELIDADEGRDLAAEIREYFIPDFREWKKHDAFEEAFARLLEALKNEGKKPKS